MNNRSFVDNQPNIRPIPRNQKTVKNGTAEHRIRKSLLYLRNLRDLRGKYMVFWHADYAEYADCSCICEICVKNCKGSCSCHLLSKLCDTLITILCGCPYNENRESGEERMAFHSSPPVSFVAAGPHHKDGAGPAVDDSLFLRGTSHKDKDGNQQQVGGQRQPL